MDGVGKSTVVKALNNEEINDVLPTNGFSFSDLKYKTVKIVFFDLGGDERIRAIWTNYYGEVHGVIYVVDGTNAAQLDGNKELLSEVIGNADLSMKPLLLLINKKDRGKCVDEIQLSDRLGLHELASRHSAQIRVEVCSAIQGTGKNIDSSITDGLDWLLDRILENYNSLAKRVSEAQERLKAKQQEDRLNRQRSTNNATTFADSTNDEKFKFAEKLATGSKQEQLAYGNSHFTSIGKKIAQQTNQIYKFAKPRVAPLGSLSTLNCKRSASDSEVPRREVNEMRVFQRTVLPNFLPPLKKPNGPWSSSKTNPQANIIQIQEVQKPSNNQMTSLSALPSVYSPSTSKATS